MPDPLLRMTYVGGPTALLEMGGVRLLTDPTFDPAGGDYSAATYVLHKTIGPALAPDSLADLDAVLLSHDHHFDNLDTAGRSLLSRARMVLTTPAGAVRLGGNAVGLAHWQEVEIPIGQRRLRVVGTPARHGPVGGDRGPVAGFVLAFADDPARAVYVSGDTVWYEDLLEVGRRFPVEVAVLFMGAARVAAAGPSPLTFTAVEGVAAARAFPAATIVPLHYEGWAHFSESRSDIQRAFDEAGLGLRLRWLPPGTPSDL